MIRCSVALLVASVTLIVGLVADCALGAVSRAQAVVRLAFYNIRSGEGVPGLPGRPVLFQDGSNCTDRSKPLNAWGTGLVQQTLTSALESDPSILALGLAESWKTVCASPERVRAVLGWKAASHVQNGVALVARYGFTDERWRQLDTSQNMSPSDTAWVLRATVCADATCRRTVLTYVAHWYATGAAEAVDLWDTGPADPRLHADDE